MMQSGTPLLLLVACAMLLTSFPGARALTDAQYSSLVSYYQNTFFANPNVTVPSIVRFAFHSCVGGCDGACHQSTRNNRQP